MTAITTRTTSTPPALSGEQLTAAIRQEHEAASAAAGAALAHALEAGRLLAEARATISHGGWESYVRESCSIAPRTASLYLRLHRHRDRLPNRQHVADLSVRQAARLLERPRVKAEPVAAVAEPVDDDIATAAGDEDKCLIGLAPDWYVPKHYHTWIHPSGWRLFVWPHPAGEPYVHLVTLDPVGDPRPEANMIAAGPKRGVHVGAAMGFIRMQRVNGMPMLSDPAWEIRTRPVPDELTADEPSYNRWLFFSDDDYRRNGLGIMPARQGASS
jgi:hypothetical protein